MTQNRLIGVTGGIGSGKSKVMEIIAKSYPTVNMDDFTENAYTEGKTALKDTFGEEIFTGDKVDKKRLRELVFSDNEKLKALNAILHPIIIKNTLDKAKALGDTVFVECPLLFEAGLEDMFCEIWLITANAETRLERVMKRDGVTKEMAQKRINAQLSDENKIAKSDVIIHNDGSVEDVEKDVSLELGKFEKRN